MRERMYAGRWSGVVLQALRFVYKASGAVKV